MRLVDIGFVAGIIDGEGCFTINKYFKNPQIGIQVQMTDKDTIFKLRDLTGLGTIVEIDRKTANWKTVWRWNVSKQKDSSSLMMTIYPLMSERRKIKIKECLTEWKSFQYRQYRNCPRGHSWKLKKETSDGKFYCSECNRINSRKSHENRQWDKYWGLESI